MLTIKEIFKKFEVNAAYTFATIENGYPETRIAHLLTYDDEGLYFQTMTVKPFYKQLKDSNKVAICSLVSEAGAAEHDEKGLPSFTPGYFIRVNGDVRELSFEELEEKAKKDDKFTPLIRDIERYPTMTTFVLYKFKGEVYDYDFEMISRDNKIERERFSYGGMKHVEAGFVISNQCIGCGQCFRVCTFKAVNRAGLGQQQYTISGNRCDECGSCYSICPVNAIIPKVKMSEEDRKIAKNKLNKWLETPQ